MRRLFIQFYLLLMSCFMAAVFMIAIVYKQAIDNVGDRYLSDLLRTTLSFIEADLRGVPEEQWATTLEKANHNFTFRVVLEKADSYLLDEESREALDQGEIVMLEDKYLFLQKIDGSNTILVAGPLRYLFFLHQLKWVDYVLLGLIGLSLAIPVFLWIRPHWRDLVSLENTAGQLANGNFSARVSLPPHSGVRQLGTAFNHMADSIATLLDSKKFLVNAVAHELRTPLARLRYRLALLEGSHDSTQHQAIERDLGTIESLVEELLLHAKLDRPKVPLNLSQFEAQSWLQERVIEQATLAPQLHWQVAPSTIELLQADQHLISRALDNLLGNARRYAQSTIYIKLSQNTQAYLLSVEDDGPGIPSSDYQRVFDVFVRLDESRGRDTGGYGLGLAIVAGIAHAHHGQVQVARSPLGGACFTLSWPIQQISN